MRLAEAGMVEFERNRGFRIVIPQPRDIAEVFHLRLLLEVPAARRVASRATPELVAALRAELAKMRQAADRHDEALLHTQHAIEMNPSDSVALYRRGSALLWVGRIDEAIAAMETARRYEPPAGTRINLTLAYHVGRVSSRVESLEEWRARVDQQFEPLYATLRRIEQLVKTRGH